MFYINKQKFHVFLFVFLSWKIAQTIVLGKKLANIQGNITIPPKNLKTLFVVF